MPPSFIATDPNSTSPLADQSTASGRLSPSPTVSATAKSRKSTGAIIGGVLGGVIALVLILVAMVFLLRREKARNVGSSTAQGRPFSRLGYSGTGVGALGGLGGWRGRGRSGDTTTTAYDEDSKGVVPHLYNSYAAGTAASHPMTSFKGKHH
jgi:hypothetical protein